MKSIDLMVTWSDLLFVWRNPGIVDRYLAYPKALGYLVPWLCLAQLNQKLKPWWEGLTVQEQRVMQQSMVRSEL